MGELTIKDIAKACGVGVSTVSRAINNHPDINPETRKKIMDIIAEKGFTPNNSARNLKRTETNSIALLVKGISNPFFADMIRIMEDYVLRKRYTTLLRHVGNDDDEVAVAQTIVTEQKVKGIVFLGGTFTHDQAALDQLNAKYVFSTIGNLNENATEEELVEACKIAQAYEFVSSFPEGFDTHIEQGGTNVSGGQKQRLCIARALLKRPKILILDDSTSAVDTRTDALIRKGFKEYIPETTKIIIAQRVASVQECDMIIIMDGGKIMGTGTHEELLKTNEIYREIYEEQTKGGSDNE